ncbi:hypothetical protein L1987_05430 [Smallanthus sonchifolius]|uniref:Uncharacterized protein n=1 Tax=Smallanthus sonchifolius TaxID=185202 RepID=A0ACB9JVR0_9ASTR|nr:hypothetical protein L1987_05430 [Smallanthus sonchifolius]
MNTEEHPYYSALSEKWWLVSTTFKFLNSSSFSIQIITNHAGISLEDCSSDLFVRVWSRAVEESRRREVELELNWD